VATERITIIVNDRGTRTVKRNINSIGKAGKESAKSTNLLKKALLAVGGVAVLKALRDTADTYTLINNRLRIVTESTQELVKVQTELFKIAQETRIAFQSTAELYTRAALAAKIFGASQEDLLRVTQAANKAVVISGSSTQESNAGLIQFAQGLSSNRLQGDELRSVLENIPRLASAIAEGLGVTRGELRELGAEGALTAETVIEALLTQEDKLNEEFARTNATIGQSLVQFRNALVLFVGQVDKFINGSSTLAPLILALSKNLDILAVSAAGIASAFALIKFAQIAKGFELLAFSIAALDAAAAGLIILAANPLALLVLGLTAATVGLIVLNKEIRNTETVLGRIVAVQEKFLSREILPDEVIKLPDFDKALIDIQEVAAVSLTARQEITSLTNTAQADLTESGRDQINQLMAFIRNRQAVLRSSLQEITELRSGPSIGRASLQLERNTIQPLIERNKVLVEEIKNAAALVQSAEDQINERLETLNRSTEAAFKKLSIEALSDFVKEFREFDADLNGVTTDVQDTIRRLSRAIKEDQFEGDSKVAAAARDLLEDLRELSNIDLTRRAQTITDPLAKQIKELEDLQTQLLSAEDGATKFSRAVESIDFQLSQLQTPFEAQLDALDKEIALLQADSVQRKVLINDMALEAAQRTANGQLTQKELQQLRSRLELTQQLNEQNKKKPNRFTLELFDTAPLDALTEKLFPAEAAVAEFSRSLLLLDEAFESGVITAEEFVRVSERLGAVFQEQVDPLGAVTRSLNQEIKLLKTDAGARDQLKRQLQIENQLRAQGVTVTREMSAEISTLLTEIEKLNAVAPDPSPLEAYKTSVLDIGPAIESTFVRGFQGAGDAIARFLTEGKAGLEDFGDVLRGVAQQILSLIIQQAIIAPIAGSITGAFGFQNGGVFNNGRVVPFANGGIIGGPSLFPLANGATGLAGEAGPEAVFPLTRLPNGELGIQAGGSGGTTNFSPTVNITVESTGRGEEADERQATRTAAEVRRQLDAAMTQFTRRQQRPGGMMNNRSIV